MPNTNHPTKYSEDFKKTIVSLYQSGKTYADIKKEYGVSSSALSNWVRKYSQVGRRRHCPYCAVDQSASAAQRWTGRGESHLKKSHCNLHATLRQRLKAIQALSKQHQISILCRVLNVNRSTYYKYVNRQPSRREQENQQLKQSEGRVYRLMKEMNLPKMSTIKP